MSSPSPDKKRKSSDGTLSENSWRAKSIERFGLQPVPGGWKDSVAVGSEEAWEKYHKCRLREEEYDRCEDDDNYDGSFTYFNEWKCAMSSRIEECMVKGSNWHWTPQLGGGLSWADPGEDLRQAEYFSYVWSPFAIPHAIELYHRYTCVVRMHTISFNTVWCYRLADFEDEESICSDMDDMGRFTPLCSNRYQDENLRADIIDVTNLNKSTYRNLRKFLYGTCSEDSEKVTCSAINFWHLILGSMGSTDPDLVTDPMRGDFGYMWKPIYNKKMRKMLFDLKAREGDDEEVGSYEHYFPTGCSWLKHRVLEITNTLGPVTKHYQHPSLKDAAGYQSPLDSEDDYY